MEKKKSSWHILGEYAINAIISLMRRVSLTHTGHWFDAQHRYGEKFALEYDDSGRMRKGILIKMIWNNVERLKV